MAREQRKLAAIIAADVVGYSRLMGRDESGTFAPAQDSAAITHTTNHGYRRLQKADR